MDARIKLLLLLVGVVLLGVAALFMAGGDAPPPPPVAEQVASGTRVMVSKRDIAVGSFVQGAQDLEWKSVPPESVTDLELKEGAASIEEYQGAVARRALRTGEPLTADAMVRKGEGGFLSAVLEPGLRAVSISVNPISGNAGFVLPGDKVDLILTHRLRPETDGGPEAVIGETFVHDVRVLAVDQTLDNPDNKPILAKTITVEVTLEQAEQIAVASEMGKVSLALRSLTAPPVAEHSDAAAIADIYGKYTRDSDVSQAGGGQRVRVIRADKVENVEGY